MLSLVEGLQISDSFLVLTVSGLVWGKSKMEENNFTFQPHTSQTNNYFLLNSM